MSKNNADNNINNNPNKYIQNLFLNFKNDILNRFKIKKIIKWYYRNKFK
jgi:hypothetical protein